MIILYGLFTFAFPTLDYLGGKSDLKRKKKKNLVVLHLCSKLPDGSRYLRKILILLSNSKFHVWGSLPALGCSCAGLFVLYKHCKHTAPTLHSLSSLSLWHRLVLVSVAIAGVKQHDQNQLREKGVYFSL